MTTRMKTVTIAALLGFVPALASASYFDGKTDLLCSVHQLFECDAAHVNNRVFAATVRDGMFAVHALPPSVALIGIV